MNPFLLTAISFPLFLWIMAGGCGLLNYWCLKQLKKENLLYNSEEPLQVGKWAGLAGFTLFASLAVEFTFDIPIRPFIPVDFST